MQSNYGVPNSLIELITSLFQLLYQGGPLGVNLTQKLSKKTQKISELTVERWSVLPSLYSSAWENITVILLK